MKSRKSPSNDSAYFWNISKSYITHTLPDIRKSSPDTIKAYRTSLNKFIDYLESEKHIQRKNISFSDFSKDNITDYLDWMLNVKKYASKTCNLRITAINSLLEYVSGENSLEFMPIYLDAKRVKCLRINSNPIEYFEEYQMKALLASPDPKTKIGRRNQMLLIQPPESPNC